MGMPWKSSCLEKKSFSAGVIGMITGAVGAGAESPKCHIPSPNKIPNPKLQNRLGDLGLGLPPMVCGFTQRRSLFHTPFMDAGGETLRELNFESQGRRFDSIKGCAIVFVLLTAEAARMGNRFPFVFIAIQQLP